MMALNENEWRKHRELRLRCDSEFIRIYKEEGLMKIANLGRLKIIFPTMVQFLFMKQILPRETQTQNQTEFVEIDFRECCKLV